ncbi:MAG: glycosyltransferase family 4 protein, partial [Dehalococcoidia bacterium]|nr:glycosyltransferase family 4 protein [Dehalococcoidia bacterium]
MSRTLMRVAMLTPEYVREGVPHGGLANYLSKICPLLKERGHCPVVFLLGDQNRESVIQGIQVTETKSPRMPECLRRRARGADVLFEDYFGARRLWKTFRRACREVAFDIVHCASHRGVGSAVVGRLPIPVVVRLSSIPMLWRCAEGTKTTLRDHMTDWLELYQLQLADGVFAPSHLLADYAHKLFGVKACVIRSPFFIPPEEEDASVYEEHLAGKNYLLFFGKLHRRKGADVIADALPKIFADFPGIHVAFVGSALSHITPGQTIGEYVLARARGRRSQVHLLGILPRRCLLPIIRNATLVV